MEQEGKTLRLVSILKDDTSEKQRDILSERVAHNLNDLAKECTDFKAVSFIAIIISDDKYRIRYTHDGNLVELIGMLDIAKMQIYQEQQDD